MGSLIELQDVSKLYGFGDATTVAIEELDLKIYKGEFVAVMGPSGSGKSTLMHIIGLLDRPTHGNYVFNGKKVSRLRPNQRAKARRDSIGFIFQQFNLLPRLNVLDNVALPLSYKGVSLTKRHKLAANVLEQVGLSDRQYYMPRHLSGGQLQRAAIARAIVNTPNIIIADEPTGNLDSGSSRLIMELLSDLHKTGNTIIMVTHNPELTRYASRVVYMHDGSIVHDEKTPIGEVAKTAQKTIIFVPRSAGQRTEDDELAGVSALMKAVPKAGDNLPRKRKRTKRKRTKRTKNNARR